MNSFLVLHSHGFLKTPKEQETYRDIYRGYLASFSSCLLLQLPNVFRI